MKPKHVTFISIIILFILIIFSTMLIGILLPQDIDPKNPTIFFWINLFTAISILCACLPVSYFDWKLRKRSLTKGEARWITLFVGLTSLLIYCLSGGLLALLMVGEQNLVLFWSLIVSFFTGVITMYFSLYLFGKLMQILHKSGITAVNLTAS